MSKQKENSGRDPLPKEEKSIPIQIYRKQKHIELLGGMPVVRKLLRNYFDSVVNAKLGEILEQRLSEIEL